MNKIFFLIKKFIPPIFIDILSWWINKIFQYGWNGDFSNWQEAKNRSKGYDAEEILLKVKDSLLAIKEGKAVHERDSVLFDTIIYSWPMLTGLLLAASCSQGKLNVLDFGGSLGSSYFQNRRFLKHLKEISWNIVEQPHFIETGKQYFANKTLNFYNSVDECLKTKKINIFFISKSIASK